MKHLKELYWEVEKRVPYMQKYLVKRIVSITLRIIADELRKDPYTFITWLGRFTDSIKQYEDLYGEVGHE